MRRYLLTLMVSGLTLSFNNGSFAADKKSNAKRIPIFSKLRGTNSNKLDGNNGVKNWAIRSDASLSRNQLEDVSTIMGLRGAVSQAVHSSAILRATTADTDAANAGVWNAIAQYAPTITGSISADHYISGYSTAVDDTTTYADIKLSLPIFTSGRRYFGVKSARSTAKATLYGGLAAGDDLKQTTIKTYLKYYYARSSLALFSKNLKDLERMKRTVEKKRSLGFASTADIYQITADVASLQLEVVNAGKLMAQSRDELESLAGSSVTVPSRLPKINHLVEGGRQAMLKAALNNNPNVIAATHSANAADYTSKATAGKYLPRVNLVSDYSRNFSGSNNDNSNELSVGVKLTMPIVNLSTVAEISESRSRALAAHYRSLDTRRLTELRTNTYWHEHVSNNERVKLATKKVEAIRWGVRSRLAKFNKGLISIDPVLEQKRLLALAEMALIQIKTDQFFATSQLLIIAGILKNSMLDG